MREKARRKDYHKKAVFTTGECADILGVCPMSVVKLFDEGRLKGYRIPYSRERRIPRESLIEFMKQAGVPCDLLLPQTIGILVVDDEPVVRAAIETVLSDEPRYKVWTASTGYDAGYLLARERPGLVILDVMLTDMDSRELAKKIRANKEFESLKILGISAFLSQEQLEALKHQGFDDFLAKPFTAAELRAKVETLLG